MPDDRQNIEGNSTDGDPTLEDDMSTTEELEYSLDDLGAAYARAMVESGMLSAEPVSAADEQPESTESGEDERQIAIFRADDDDDDGVSPSSIVEAAFFVGHPENKPITAAQVAATMRGVSAEEVTEIVAELNEHYRSFGHALRIVERDGGFVFTIADELRSVRSAFYGKVRETRLNQATIEVLALVAYQPGITAGQITTQRGKESGAIVNQLVRRELLEMRREAAEDGKLVSTYHPAPRLFNLLGIGGIDDLPQVDENHLTALDL